MKKFTVIIILVVFLFGFTTINNYENAELVKTAIIKSLPLLQKSSYTFLINADGCHSCHGQGLGGVAFALAEQKGFAVADTIVKQAMDSICINWQQRKHYLNQNEDPAAITIGGGYDLWALKATHTKTTKAIELLAKNIMQRQRVDGSWITPNMRPPMEYYNISATALAIKGIQESLPGVFKTEVAGRVVKAKNWLTDVHAEQNEEKAFQLLGLHWCDADAAVMKPLAKKLLATQHADGGWSQIATLPSDAYATGQALYALNQSGQLATTGIAYQRGITFLLKTQFEDGSWKVLTRSFPSVPYVDSGFPHGDHQFISAAGTNWATMALLLAVK